MKQEAESKKLKAEVEQLRYPKPGSLTDLPEAIRSFFASRGETLSWQRKTEENITMLYGLRAVPVTIDAIKEAGASKDVLEALHVLFRPTAEGYLQRGDTILMSMPLAQREALFEHENRMRKNLERGHVVEDAFERELEEAARSVGVPSKHLYRSKHHRIPDASAHIK